MSEIKPGSPEFFAREAVAGWMILRGYATGHGDTVQDLLFELEAQAAKHGGQPELPPGEGDFRILQARVEAAEAKVEKLHVVAKNVSHALMSFTPGGSEYFTRVKVGEWEDYYADADACQQRVRERINSAEERARNAFRASPVTSGNPS